MAIDTIPPWLNVQPENFVEAAKSGTALGLQIAAQQNRAAESAAELAAKQEEADARRWEFAQKLRQDALDSAAKREQAAAELAETTRFHTGSLENAGLNSLAQAMHWKAMENAALARGPGRSIRTIPGGGIVEVLPDGTIKTLRESDPREALLTSNAALDATIDPVKRLYTMREYGKDFFNQLKERAKRGVPPSIATNAAAGPPLSLTNPPPVATVRIGPLGPNEVERMVNGRKAAFDATTHKFVRYLE